MKKKADQTVAAYLAKIGRKGGHMRAAKYEKATLSEWAKKGGRPRKTKAMKEV